MTKEEKVVAAIYDHNSGIDLKTILVRYKCSKSWFYKWLKRYKANPTGDWFIEESRRPQTIHYKISDEQKQLIIGARKSLEKNPYSQRGAITIQYDLQAQGKPILP